MLSKKKQVSRKQVLDRMDEFVSSFIHDPANKNANLEKVQEASKIFVDSLTPLEKGLVWWDDAIPIKLSSLSKDETEYYVEKYGMENIEKGCLFRRVSTGSTEFIAHEYGLSAKMSRLR